MMNCLKRHILFLTMFSLVICVGFLAARPVCSYAKATANSKAKTSKKKTTKKKTSKKKKKKIASATVKNEKQNITAAIGGSNSTVSTKENREVFLNICSDIGQRMHDEGFRYGYSSGARSYKSALKNSRVATCATYVSWCLQEYGVLKEGKLFYGTGGGRPNKTNWDKDKIKVVKIYKTTKNANLKPGDVICWATGKDHVCVYAGKNKSGQRVWYDAGRHQSTYGQCAGSLYKPITARHNKYLENRLVGYVIRII